MASQNIVFGAPPVIETVLSVQFQPIPGFTSAHAGCFWQGALAPNFPDWQNAKFMETQRLEDAFEDMAAEPSFGVPSFQLRASDPASRVQIIGSDEERMIQIQDSRFIYNWRKRHGKYPTYSIIKPEFDLLFQRFETYLEGAAFPPPQANQWEVIYTNHIPKGELWSGVADWVATIPGLYIPTGSPEDVDFETMAGMWRYRLPEGRGRLHISLQHGRTLDKQEVILLQFIARGPVGDGGLTVNAGLSTGHNAIVNTFHQMTSAQMHLEWKEGNQNDN